MTWKYWWWWLGNTWCEKAGAGGLIWHFPVTNLVWNIHNQSEGDNGAIVTDVTVTGDQGCIIKHVKTKQKNLHFKVNWSFNQSYLGFIVLLNSAKINSSSDSQHSPLLRELSAAAPDCILFSSGLYSVQRHKGEWWPVTGCESLSPSPGIGPGGAIWHCFRFCDKLSDTDLRQCHYATHLVQMQHFS